MMTKKTDAKNDRTKYPHLLMSQIYMMAMAYDMGVRTNMKDQEMSRFHPENDSLLKFAMFYIYFLICIFYMTLFFMRINRVLSNGNLLGQKVRYFYIFLKK